MHVPFLPGCGLYNSSVRLKNSKKTKKVKKLKKNKNGGKNMKGKWVMLWDVRWTNSVEDIGGKEFNSFDAVKKAAREKIREIDVSDVVAFIRSGINKDYCNAIGDFFLEVFYRSQFSEERRGYSLDRYKGLPYAGTRNARGRRNRRF